VVAKSPPQHRVKEKPKVKKVAKKNKEAEARLRAPASSG
jgi:hypothetical protein